MLPRRCTLGKISLRYEFIKSCDFSEGVIEVAKIAFCLERAYGRILLTDFGGTFSANFFLCHFFLGQGQNTSGKKPYRNPVNENSSKVRRNTSPRERWKNYAKTQTALHLKRQSWHVSWYLQFNHSKQRERFEDIKK